MLMLSINSSADETTKAIIDRDRLLAAHRQDAAEPPPLEQIQSHKYQQTGNPQDFQQQQVGILDILLDIVR